MAAGASIRAAAITAIAPARRICLSIMTRMSSLLWGRNSCLPLSPESSGAVGRNLDRIAGFVLSDPDRTYAFLRESKGHADKFRSSPRNQERNQESPRAEG